MSIRPNVKIEKFAENHFIKRFSKQYKKLWDITLRSILLELERFGEFVKTSHINFISSYDNFFIYKSEFKIAGSKISRKASGNRCILSLDKNKNQITILLIYHKNDIGDKNETAAWKKIIRDNYEEYYFLK